MTKKFYAIIPARYASTRFPGKPLALINGKPMFWHVYQRTQLCKGIDATWLATDDARIASVAQELGVPYVLTREDHQSGSDRVCEAAEKLELVLDSVVINVQGDEPALDPANLDKLIDAFKDPQVKVATLAAKLVPEKADNPNTVKVVTDGNNNALYFSRSSIPFWRDRSLCDASNTGYFLGHIGVYAFQFAVLQQYTQLPQSPLEQQEKLEQLRLLENGIAIRIVEVVAHAKGVDTPEDLDIVKKILV